MSDNKRYSVVSVTERVRITPAGQPDTEYVVTIETGLGATGQVIIPARMYRNLTDDELVDVLNDKADELNRPFLV